MAAEKLLVGSFKLISQAALLQMLLPQYPPGDVNFSRTHESEACLSKQ
jgi:hypothetical protein